MTIAHTVGSGAGVAGPADGAGSRDLGQRDAAGRRRAWQQAFESALLQTGWLDLRGPTTLGCTALGGGATIAVAASAAVSAPARTATPGAPAAVERSAAPVGAKPLAATAPTARDTAPARDAASAERPSLASTRGAAGLAVGTPARDPAASPRPGESAPPAVPPPAPLGEVTAAPGAGARPVPRADDAPADRGAFAAAAAAPGSTTISIAALSAGVEGRRGQALDLGGAAPPPSPRPLSPAAPPPLGAAAEPWSTAGAVAERAVLAAAEEIGEAAPAHPAAEAAAAKPAGPRWHVEWTDDGVRVWLGVDYDPEVPAALLERALLEHVQRWLDGRGLRLLQLVCNGRTVWGDQLDGPGGAPGRRAPEGSTARDPESFQASLSQEVPWTSAQ